MKLTLRELFLLVALVAMGCGWWVDRSKLATDLNELSVAYDTIFAEWHPPRDYKWHSPRDYKRP